MRVAMFGYQTWGHRTLRALIDAGHDVALVVTHPKSDHAYEKIWADSVADLAEANGIRTLLRQRPDDAELLAELKEADLDLIVANNWRTWLPPEIFEMPRHGTLNVHDSLLPAYAGFSPLIWALINGEQEVGLTAHMMDADLDAGDIVLQRSVQVGPKDTTTDLFHRTVDLIAPITTDAIELIEKGNFTPVKQDRSKASFFHKRALQDSLIDWSWPADEIERLVRAQSDPYPNAFTHHRGKQLRVVRSSVSTGLYGGTPGRIFIREGEGVVIVTGPESRRGRSHGLVIERVRTEDGTELSANEYFRTLGGYLTNRP
ncbi:methionyl-tRNA formyltransferase [Amycolatopsis alba]|uniref:Methionyl-tRNA formyltransferase n=1 Tax=Amycolatopsis alba DSM 44262 TaxID=1125972 RepID=A0A229S6C7_AMYAL|nr:methionyl-tRNA formyltransferase [Amycolatopsis alba]OXM54440.1 methionyl-tRNA formyltransferase [Amycolatopsis alba DSM 44262]